MAYEIGDFILIRDDSVIAVSNNTQFTNKDFIRVVNPNKELPTDVVAKVSKDFIWIPISRNSWEE